MKTARGRNYKSKPVGPSPKSTSPSVSKSMKSNKSSGTKLELEVARLLGRRLLKSKLPGKPDFVFPKSKLVVFVHGDWWHRNPSLALRLPKEHREYWKRKFARNVERDQLVSRELEAMGWRVVVVWESEIRADPQRVASRVKELVALRRKA